MVALSGLAERTFTRRFAQATGRGPLDYVQHLRLEEAKQMLESGDASIESIAFEVGYKGGPQDRPEATRSASMSALRSIAALS